VQGIEVEAQDEAQDVDGMSGEESEEDELEESGRDTSGEDESEEEEEEWEGVDEGDLPQARCACCLLASWPT
jgi:hypothetical protein